MNKEEARALAAVELEKYRKKSYRELVKLIDEPENREVVGSSGIKYQLEINALWDDKPNGVLRVMSAIGDDGITAYVPLCDDFLIAPNGKFVDE